jgi:hypothetical protein
MVMNKIGATMNYDPDLKKSGRAMMERSPNG